MAYLERYRNWYMEWGAAIIKRKTHSIDLEIEQMEQENLFETRRLETIA